MGHVGPGVPKEREGPLRGAQWRREDGPVEDGGRRRSWSEACKAVLTLRNFKGRGRRLCQANRKTEGGEV